MFPREWGKQNKTKIEPEHFLINFQVKGLLVTECMAHCLSLLSKYISCWMLSVLEMCTQYDTVVIILNLFTAFKYLLIAGGYFSYIWARYWGGLTFESFSWLFWLFCCGKLSCRLLFLVFVCWFCFEPISCGPTVCVLWDLLYVPCLMYCLYRKYISMRSLHLCIC